MSRLFLARNIEDGNASGASRPWGCGILATAQPRGRRLLEVARWSTMEAV
jgi:hypothetical protein